MNNFFRTYKTLKLFRDKKRTIELDALASENRDSEYRELYIEETEKDLHVIFSKQFICFRLSFMFLIILITLISTKFIIFSIISGLLSLFFLYLSQSLKNRFTKTARDYTMTVNILNKYMENMFGIVR